MELPKSSKERIKNRLEVYLKQKAEMFKDYGYSEDIYEKLFSYSTKGKMIRGSLFLTSCELFWNNTDESLVDVACAIELLHSGFLIQDDIMDKDTKRRGMNSMHIQYENESLALCLADIAFFLSFGLMRKYPQMLVFMTDIMTRTGLGQMMDVKPISMTEETVMKVYEAKTAYYTFHLPLGMASIICTGKVEDGFFALSKRLGLLFQITDDILGFNGDPTKTGKAVGSDIEQRKYTLYISHLLSVSSPEDTQLLKRIYDSEHMSEEDKKNIHILYDKYGIGDYLNSQLSTQMQKIKHLIHESSYNDDAKKYILSLSEYIVSRCL